MWKHDKFGKESEDEAEEMQLPVTAEKERNTDRREGRGDDGLRRVGGDLRDRMNMRARDNREQRPGIYVTLNFFCRKHFLEEFLMLPFYEGK